MRRPQNSFWTLPQPQNSPLGPQKVKNGPKIKLKSKVWIEVKLENESISATWVEPKTVGEPYHNPKNTLLGSQKVKNDPNIKSKSNARI